MGVRSGRVLSGLNTALCGKFQGHYVTGAYVYVDTEKRTLRYAGAGHPPILFRDKESGRARKVLENGVFLGFFPGAEYTSIEMPFREGDCLVLYTDGVSESPNAADEMFGETRFPAYLQENGDATAASFVEGLIEELSRWSGRSETEHDDDVTLLTVRFCAAAGSEVAAAPA